MSQQNPYDQGHSHAFMGRSNYAWAWQNQGDLLDVPPDQEAANVAAYQRGYADGIAALKEQRFAAIREYMDALRRPADPMSAYEDREDADDTPPQRVFGGDIHAE